MAAVSSNSFNYPLFPGKEPIVYGKRVIARDVENDTDSGSDTCKDLINKEECTAMGKTGFENDTEFLTDSSSDTDEDRMTKEEECTDLSNEPIVDGLRDIDIELTKTYFPVQYQEMMDIYKLACTDYQNNRVCVCLHSFLFFPTVIIFNYSTFLGRRNL